MSEIFAVIFLLGLGFVVGRYLFPKGPRDPNEPRLFDDEPEYPCPWCQAPLLEKPLVEEQEDADEFAVYAEENCPSCHNVIKYNDYTCEYDRFKPKVDNSTKSA